MRQSNSAKVQSLAHDISGRMKDKEFFLSNAVRKFFYDRVMGLTSRYGTKARGAKVGVDIIWSDPDDTAWTDNVSIHANANCSLIEGERADKFLALEGLCDHEASHVLYTDFPMMMRVMAHIDEGELWPAPTVPMPRLGEMLKDHKHLGQIKAIWKELGNVLEDAYIEKRFLKEHQNPVHRDGLIEIRRLLKEQLPTLSEMKAKEADPMQEWPMSATIMQSLLGFSRFGELPCEPSEESDPRMEAVRKTAPYVEKALDELPSNEHYRAINDVMAALDDVLADWLDSMPEDGPQDGEGQGGQGQGNGSGSGAGGCGSALGQMSQSNGTASEQQHGTRTRGPLAPQPKAGKKAPKDGGNAQEAEKAGGGDGAEGKKEPGAAGGDGEDKAKGANGDDGQETGSQGEGEGQGPDKDGQPAGGDSSGESEPGGGWGACQDSGSGPRAAEAVKRLLGIASREEAAKRLEKEAAGELQAENAAAADTYGDAHQGVFCNVTRPDIPGSAAEEWANDRSVVEPIVKSTVKALRPALKERQLGGVQKGLYFGKQLPASSFARTDKKLFVNKKLPSDVPDLAVALVLDESGSMSGEKIRNAQGMARCVYRICEELGIRSLIIGHRESWPDVQIEVYTDFDDGYDGKDMLRLAAMRAGGCNRDGYANRYAYRRLENEVARRKLCIIVSDGQPAGSGGYHGEKAAADMRDAMRRAKGKGIETIAAAIDEDKERIREIYGADSFLDITDLSQLSGRIVAAIKKCLPR